MASGDCGVKGTQSGGRVADDQDKKCFLCGRVDRYMTRFTNWKSNEKEFVLQHVVKTPSDSSYMCKKCKLEAKRHHDTHHYIPKWKRHS